VPDNPEAAVIYKRAQLQGTKQEQVPICIGLELTQSQLFAVMQALQGWQTGM